MPVHCSQCGYKCPPDYAFCPRCGTSLAISDAESRHHEPQAIPELIRRYLPQGYAERLLQARGQKSGERRVVTILFCDVTGSTAMAEHLDPEDVMDIMDGAFDVLIEPIVRYEGTLARLMGDAVLAFFGAPIAHEDDPERACLAALEIIKRARDYARHLEATRGILGFNVRAGINTGLVVVGEVGSDLRAEYTAMGDAVNLAARMESAAEPGTILISGNTYELVAPLFDIQERGPIQVKGRSALVSTYRVQGTKKHLAKTRGILELEPELVGRTQELDLLRSTLDRLLARQGGIVTISGEAGIGKSRLVAELRRVGQRAILADGNQGRGDELAISLTPLQWIEARCVSHGGSIAYLLWTEVLRQALHVPMDVSPIAVGEKLTSWLQQICPDHIDETLPYLAALLSAPLAAHWPGLPDGLPGEELRQRTFKAVEIAVASLARARPLLVVLEDVHWSDPTSLDLLEHLLTLVEKVPLLIIALFRPYREHRCWRLRGIAAERYGDHHLDLLLAPLPPAEIQCLLRNLLREGRLPRLLTKRILDRVDGNPLYLEELFRSLLDAGIIIQASGTDRWAVTQEVSAIPIPETLQGLLVARIDRLQEDTRHLLQMASVVGRVFQYRVLAAMTDGALKMDAHLEVLQQEDMIRERSHLPELEYAFRHELTRDAAYNGLLKRERRSFHRQVAEALEQLFPALSDQQPEILAHHWQRAEEPRKAIPCLSRAGERSARLSAYQEAIDHFTQALQLVTALPISEERDRLELGLHASMIPPLIAVGSYGDPRVGAAITRALTIGKRVGDPPQLFLPLVAVAAFHGMRAQYDEAQERWGELMNLADRVGDPLLKALSHWLGWVPLFLGDPDRALRHLDQVVEFYDPEQHGALALLYGVDPGAICLAWSSWALWLLGYPDQALQRSDQALALSARLGHPHTQAFTQAVAGLILGQCMGRIDMVSKWLEPTLHLCREHDFAFFLARATASQGWLLVEQGQMEAGIEQLQRGLDQMRSTGSEMYVPMELALLGDACTRSGQQHKAEQYLVSALQETAETGERLYEPEIHRLTGQLMLAREDLAGAEACFRQAIQVARDQSAKSWELRATLSLCHLLVDLGQQVEARDTLSGVYRWFTEGLGTPDLQKAISLLRSLL